MNVVFVVSAFETTNNEVLAVLDKGHTAGDMAEATRIIRDAGIQVRPSWMPFTPLTEPGDVGDIFDFLVELDLLAAVDPVQLSIRLLIPDGSLILGSEMAPFIGDYDPDALTYRWTARDPRVDDLQAKLAVDRRGRRDAISGAPSPDVVAVRPGVPPARVDRDPTDPLVGVVVLLRRADHPPTPPGRPPGNTPDDPAHSPYLTAKYFAL